MKLTDAQIRELAPDWASHYNEFGSGSIVFQSDSCRQWIHLGKFEPKVDASIEILIGSIPIPRKLPNNTAVLRSEVKTQDDLDAMVEVARFNGFDMKSQHLGIYDELYLFVNNDTKCLQQSSSNRKVRDVITLKEFLSYGEQPMQFADESTPKAKEERPAPPVKPPAVESMTMEEWIKRKESQPPIDQIAEIMRREGITSLNLSMMSDGRVTGSFDVESGGE